MNGFAVFLNQGHQLIVGLPSQDFSAWAVDYFRHRFLPFLLCFVGCGYNINHFLPKPWRFMGHIMTMWIYLSGRVAIELDGQVFIDQNQSRGRQGRLVFAYLVAQRTHPVSRQKLASLI